MKYLRFTVVLFMAAFASQPVISRAQDKPIAPGAAAAAGGGIGARPPGAEVPATITRVYDVRDLVTELPNFPALPKPLPGGPAQNPFGTGSGADPRGGGMTGSAGLFPGPGGPAVLGNIAGGPPGAMVGGVQSAPLSQVDELTRLIVETVSTDSWRDTGGNVGVIRYFRGNLVVTQTAEAHELIRKLLTDLRGDIAMVRVRARWVLLKPSDFDHLIKRPGGPQANPPSVLQEVNLADLDAAATHSVQFRAQTICFSGQTVSVASGRQKSVVSTVEAVVGTDVGAYQPTVGFLNSGLTLQVRPTFNRDDATVNMTIDSTFSGPSETSPAMAGHLVGPATRPLGAGGDTGGMIDRINAVSQNLRTTVRLQLNKSVLIGGMTLEPADNGEETPQLYLIMEASASP